MQSYSIIALVLLRIMFVRHVRWKEVNGLNRVYTEFKQSLLTDTPA